MAVLACNEAEELRLLLASVHFADEVVVADAGSDDATAAVAAAAGARVIPVANDINLNRNKTVAIQALRTDWIMYLDPDERVPAELAAAVQAAIRSGSFAGYEFPRRNNYFGRYLRFGGAYPDYQLRLFQRGRASFPCLSVHERLTVAGPVGRLGPALIHETYPRVQDYLRKLPLYVAAGAETMERQGAPAGGVWDFYFLVFRPALRFIRRYFLRLGVLDGGPGLLAALLDALQSMLTYYSYRGRRRACTCEDPARK